MLIVTDPVKLAYIVNMGSSTYELTFSLMN